MPEVRGHMRRTGLFRRTWVRPHYRRRARQNWWIAPAVAAVILLVLWLIFEH